MGQCGFDSISVATDGIWHEDERRAASLRGELPASTRARYLEGRRRLLLRLAYMQLSNLDGSAARASVRSAWQAGAPVSARSAAIFTASLLPAWALDGLHALKRRVRG